MDSTREYVIRRYRDRARHYDLTANLYYLLGFREWAYRRQAVQVLRLFHDLRNELVRKSWNVRVVAVAELVVVEFAYECKHPH
jgi:hypothetical protein